MYGMVYYIVIVVGTVEGVEKYSKALYYLKNRCGKICVFLFKSVLKKSGEVWEIFENPIVEIVERGGKVCGLQ